MHTLSDPHLPMVYRIAKRLARSMPRCVDVADLINDGFLGLHDARLKFQSARRVAFPRFASRRIRGAMLDGLRSRDWLPRGYHAQSSPIRFGPLNDCIDLSPDQRQELEHVECIDRLLRDLPDRTWLAIQLHYLESIPLKAIGQRLGITEAGASLLCSRALKRIAKTAREAV
jgi:RNA polymerase sigma factor (sigma-70 family)